METISVFYNALGYLGLTCAILWGMLFVGDGSHPSLMDTAGGVRLQGVWVDVGLLLSMAGLHRLIHRGLGHAGERGTQSWVAGAALFVIYAFWQPLPKILWTTADSVQWVMSALFYIGGTLIFIGLLSCHFDFFQDAGSRGEAPRTLGEPIHGGILVAVWATSSMTVGHLLLASAFTVYLALDAFWSAWRSGAREEGGTMPLESQRFLR